MSVMSSKSEVQRARLASEASIVCVAILAVLAATWYITHWLYDRFPHTMQVIGATVVGGVILLIAIAIALVVGVIAERMRR